MQNQQSNGILLEEGPWAFDQGDRLTRLAPYKQPTTKISYACGRCGVEIQSPEAL